MRVEQNPDNPYQKSLLMEQIVLKAIAVVACALFCMQPKGGQVQRPGRKNIMPLPVVEPQEQNLPRPPKVLEISKPVNLNDDKPLDPIPAPLDQNPAAKAAQ